MNELLREIEAFEKNTSFVKVFGVIIYSHRHPYVKKVLADEDFWRALDEISGERWGIFAVRAIEGRAETKGGGPPGTFSMMIRMWVEPSENRKLIKYLNLESTEDPLFVIFTRLRTGEILKTVLPLDNSSVDAAYGRLKRIISDLTWAIGKIETENIEDHESVFNAVNMTAEGIQTWDTVRRIFEFYQWVKKVKP